MHRKSLVALLMIAALVSALSPTASVATHETGQEVKATVLAPPLPAKNVSRGGRSLVIISQMLNVNGVGGYYFEPDPDTIGAPFTLKPVGTYDVDVFFYEDLGDLVSAPAVIVGEHSAENTDGEKGFVPVGTKWVVIYYGVCADCVPAGLPAAVPFVYQAENTPVVTIDGSTLELGRTEVHAGGQVFLDNLTEGPLTLQADAPEGKTPAFQTFEPFTGKILLDTSSVAVGEYTFTVSNGATGTLVII